MKTIVGLFDSVQEAQDVVRDLESAGFSREQISLVTQREAVASSGNGEATATGAVIGAGVGILAGLVAVTVPGVGVVAALGPILAGGLMGAVTGGLIGSLVDAGVPEEEAAFYNEGVRRGGTLVTVATRDEDAPRAVEIMNRHHPVDLNARAATWRQAGWTPAGSRSAAQSTSTPSQSSLAPDPTGQTTMGDAAAAMPAPTMAIPAQGAQPTREVNAPTTGQASASSATGGSGSSSIPLADDYSRLEPEFQNDFRSAAAPGADYTYEECKPAYVYGCELARECRGSDWNAVEPQARNTWEQRHPGTWDRVKNAARYAYDRAKQQA